MGGGDVHRRVWGGGCRFMDGSRWVGVGLWMAVGGLVWVYGWL